MRIYVAPLLMGLKPDLKRHAIQMGPTSLNELLRCVKKAKEADSIASQTRDSIAETLKRIEQKLSAGDTHSSAVTPIVDMNSEDMPRTRSTSIGRHQSRSIQREGSPSRSSSARGFCDSQRQVRFDPALDLKPTYSSINMEPSSQQYLHQQQVQSQFVQPQLVQPQCVQQQFADPSKVPKTVRAAT